MSIYDSWNRKDKVPFGAVKVGTKVKFQIRLKEDYASAWLVTCKFHDWENETRYPMTWIKKEGDDNVFEVTAPFDKIQIYGYIFEYNTESNPKIRYIKKKNEYSNTAWVSEDKQGRHWLLTVHAPSLLGSENKGEISLHIFPDRFYNAVDNKTKKFPKGAIIMPWGAFPIYLPNEQGIVENNDYYGGDLQGIIEKLDYIEELGVTRIYLMPIVKSQENHGYTTLDYLEVNPPLGTWEDLKELCSKAHARGIKIVLDGVFNHVGRESYYFQEALRDENSEYFKEAQSDEKSRYHDWFDFDPTKEKYIHGYNAWWNFPNLPTIKRNCIDFQNFIINEVLPLWFSMGIDGLRIDVADELSNEFLQKIFATVKKLGGTYICAEVWENAATKEAYGEQKEYLLGDKITCTMNYPFRKAIIRYLKYADAYYFYDRVMKIYEYYPKDNLDSAMNFPSTHDTNRFMTEVEGVEMPDPNKTYYGIIRELQARNDRLSDEQYERAKRKLKLANILLYGLPGNPSIFYGEELGLHGYECPFNRKSMPWEDDSKDEELLEFYKAIGRIRTEHRNIIIGDFQILVCNENVLAFERIAEDQKTKMLFSINRSKEGEVVIPEEYQKNTASVLLEVKDADRIIGKIIVSNM